MDDLARIREVVADTWHVVGYLSELWEQRGLTVVEYPQFDSRLVPATDRLHRAVTERGLTHPDDPLLNQHVAGSLLRDTRRGARIDKRPGLNNDGMIALLMAVDRAEQPKGVAQIRRLGLISLLTLLPQAASPRNRRLPGPDGASHAKHRCTYRLLSALRRDRARLAGQNESTGSKPGCVRRR